MKKIYFVGAPTREKGIEEFNEIARHINNSEFYWFCYVISEDLKRKYSNIQFITGLSSSELNYYIKKMDIFASMSHYEGFCLPIGEAILNCKPVISFKLEEIEMTYKNLITYVEPFNIDEYIYKLNKITLKKYKKIYLNQLKTSLEKKYLPEVVAQKIVQFVQITRTK